MEAPVTDAAEPEAEASVVTPEAEAATAETPDATGAVAEEPATEPEAAEAAEAATAAVTDAPASEPAPEEQEEEEAAAEPAAEAAEAADTTVTPQADAVADDATDVEAAPEEQDIAPAAVAAEPEAEPEAEAAATEPEAETQPEAQEAAEAPAEPEPLAAEADAETQPEAPADTEPEAEPLAAEAPADSEPEAEAQPEPLAAEAPAAHLSDAHDAAGAQLRAQGLGGSRAAVYLVVDRSGSMRGYFKDGSVQRLAEQVTALAAHLDEDATVTTVFFSTDIDGTVELTPATLTPTRIEEVNATLGRLGRTNYHRAVEEVLAHHGKADPARPALVVFQTDGAPESKTAATQALAEAAERPLHWRFVAWGEEDNKAFDFVRKLDGTPRTGTYFAGATPVETEHAAFYRGLLAGLEL
ncbi:VWA domain-containing protein [Streptomyces sp. NPDC001728]|uniref:VWA domain-containing protein n=1 Tax=Streptomyces sp. NPDC001728 TaxID=3154396 RepID=UPI00332F6333